LKPYLLDINVLIALAWPTHVHHGGTQRWFAAHRAAGFRTCPLTQTGFVRISSNSKFLPDAVSPLQALELLDRITSMSEHSFWPDDLTLRETIGTGRILVGHRQISDAYLIALAEQHGGIVATLDRTMLSTTSREGTVELLSGE